MKRYERFEVRIKPLEAAGVDHTHEVRVQSEAGKGEAKVIFDPQSESWTTDLARVRGLEVDLELRKEVGESLFQAILQHKNIKRDRGHRQNNVCRRHRNARCYTRDKIHHITMLDHHAFGTTG